MAYNVQMTERAQSHLDEHVRYLLYDVKSRQAAEHLLSAALKAIQRLSYTASSGALCRHEKLAECGYRLMQLDRMRYFFVYRIHEEMVFVDAVVHELQDYENLLTTDSV